MPRIQRRRKDFESSNATDDDEATAPSTQHLAACVTLGKYAKDTEHLKTFSDWRSLPEIPTAEELLRPVDDTCEPFASDDNDGLYVRVRPHEISAEWQSKSIVGRVNLV